MIEVLVSIVILAFGLLGIASMQMLALKNSLRWLTLSLPLCR